MGKITYKKGGKHTWNKVHAQLSAMNPTCECAEAHVFLEMYAQHPMSALECYCHVFDVDIHVFSKMSKRKRTSSDSKRPSKKTKQAQHTAQLMKELAAREIHYHNTNVVFSLVGAPSGAVMDADYNLLPPALSYSHVAQGDTISTRTGRKIAINAIRFQIRMLWPGTNSQISTPHHAPCKFWLAIDKQCNGQIPNPNPQSQMLTNDGILSVLSTVSFGRYRLLKEKLVHPDVNETSILESTPNTSYIGTAEKVFKIKHKFKKPLIVNFNGQSFGDVRDLVDNNIFLMGCVVDTQTSVTSCQICSRLAFTDL